MPRLTIFKAEEAPIALIICRYKRNHQNQYQLIRWDLTTNQFTEGQWLMKKQLWINGCSISPDGQYFYWIYNTYQDRYDNTHVGISEIPFFTALMYGKGNGRYHLARFDKDTKLPINDQGLQNRLQNLPCSEYSAISQFLDSGLMPKIWFDNGNTIRTEGYQIFVNEELVYDATDNVFQDIPYHRR